MAFPGRLVRLGDTHSPRRPKPAECGSNCGTAGFAELRGGDTSSNDFSAMLGPFLLYVVSYQVEKFGLHISAHVPF